MLTENSCMKQRSNQVLQLDADGSPSSAYRLSRRQVGATSVADFPWKQTIQAVRKYSPGMSRTTNRVATSNDAIDQQCDLLVHFCRVVRSGSIFMG